MRLTIVNDPRLLELAAPRARELFPVLRRAAAVAPLLAALSFLAALFALDRARLDEGDAAWGLRSFEMLSANSAAEVLDPDPSPLITHLRWQPPLGSWLTAAAMGVIGPTRLLALYLVPFAATVGLVGAIYGLSRSLLDARTAFWVALFVAGSAAFLPMAQEAAPHAVALAFAAGAFWGYLAHLKSGPSAVSFKLLGGGISLGLCLLSGGPVAFVVVAVLLLFVLGFRGEGSKRGKAHRGRVWNGWPALWSLVLLCTTGFAVGGWWLMMMSSNHGADFWNGWIGVMALPDSADGGTRDASDFLAFSRFLDATGVLCGLALAGLFHACALLYTSQRDDERLAAHFLLSWTACGLVVWLSLLRNPAVPEHVVLLWQRFLAIPLAIAGACSVDRIDRRTIGFALASGLILASTIIVLGHDLRSADRHDAAAEITGWWIAYLVVLGGAAWWAFRYRRNRYIVQQTLLAGLLVSLVSVNGSLGLAEVSLDTREENSLQALRTALAPHSRAERCTVISADEPPLRLRYVLETTLPRAQLTHVEHWDAALSQALSEHGRERVSIVVVDWSVRDTRPATIPIPGVSVTPIASVQTFEGRQLRTYLMTTRRR